MDVHTLSTTMANQAGASAGTQSTVNVQKADNDGASKTGSGDTVDLSAEGRAKAASGAAQPAQGDTSNLTSRITKLQKQLQQEMGSSNQPDDKKKAAIAALRNQIMLLQSQLPKSGSGSTGGASASTLSTSHA